MQQLAISLLLNRAKRGLWRWALSAAANAVQVRSGSSQSHPPFYPTTGMPLPADVQEALSRSILDYSAHRLACKLPAPDAPTPSAAPEPAPLPTASLSAATAAVSEACGKVASFAAGDVQGAELLASTRAALGALAGLALGPAHALGARLARSLFEALEGTASAALAPDRAGAAAQPLRAACAALHAVQAWAEALPPPLEEPEGAGGALADAGAAAACTRAAWLALRAGPPRAAAPLPWSWLYASHALLGLRREAGEAAAAPLAAARASLALLVHPFSLDAGAAPAPSAPAAAALRLVEGLQGLQEHFSAGCPSPPQPLLPHLFARAQEATCSCLLPALTEPATLRALECAEDAAGQPLPASALEACQLMRAVWECDQGSSALRGQCLSAMLQAQGMPLRLYIHAHIRAAWHAGGCSARFVQSAGEAFCSSSNSNSSAELSRASSAAVHALREALQQAWQWEESALLRATAARAAGECLSAALLQVFSVCSSASSVHARRGGELAPLPPPPLALLQPLPRPSSARMQAALAAVGLLPPPTHTLAAALAGHAYAALLQPLDSSPLHAAQPHSAQHWLRTAQCLLWSVQCCVWGEAALALHGVCQVGGGVGGAGEGESEEAVAFAEPVVAAAHGALACVGAGVALLVAGGGGGEGERQWELQRLKGLLGGSGSGMAAAHLEELAGRAIAALELTWGNG